MRRYWVPIDTIQNGEVVLSGDVLHHIRDVCRMTKGSKFEVLAGGKAYLVEIKSESKHESRATVIEERTIQALPKPELVLVLAIPRFPVFEAVIEKAVELGVSRVQPVFSEFSFIRTQDDVLEKKRARWEKIIIGATQQSGRGDLMPIEAAKNLKEVVDSLNRKSSSKGLFAYEGDVGTGSSSNTLSAKEGLARLREGDGMDSNRPSEIFIFVGSEGGFSEREVQLFQSVGLQPVTLGSQVLRVETACVALISILKYDFDQMR
jgi:16S rRNA (uracil1498-N3)-methyltransferase